MFPAPAAVCKGHPRRSEVAGYYGWKIKNSVWGYGTFDLTMIFPRTDGELRAELTRPLDETAISIR
ncbi:MAG: hypothetical protein WC340_11070 [Kiritimatiellia bacterium]